MEKVQQQQQSAAAISSSSKYKHTVFRYVSVDLLSTVS
jgi:hypothetical protein